VAVGGLYRRGKIEPGSGGVCEEIEGGGVRCGRRHAEEEEGRGTGLGGVWHRQQRVGGGGERWSGVCHVSSGAGRHAWTA
jgi:hypothetical protein